MASTGTYVLHATCSKKGCVIRKKRANDLLNNGERRKPYLTLEKMHNVGIRTWKTTVRWKFLLAGQLVNMVWVGDIVQNVDNETENWPVLPKFRGDLDEIKYEYEANPLPVYTETDKFVEPLDVKATIRGALVEVQFDLHHYCIRSKLQDSFNATMVQILVIQPGKAEPVLSNKRKNVRDGPVCLNPSSAKQKKTTDEDEPVAGSSTERS